MSQPRGHRDRMEQTIETSSVTLERLVASMDKAFRSFRLYEARGPQYEAHVREMASQAALATEQGPAVLIVTPHGLLVENQQRAKEPELNRTWFELFEQGARQVIFTPGIETAEVREMLQIMAGDHQEEDILTVLWRRELAHIQISVARTLVRGRRTEGSTTETLEAQYGHWRNLLVPDARTSERRIQISPDDLRVLAVQSEPLSWCADCRAPLHSATQETLFERDRTDLDVFIDMLDSLDPAEVDQVLTMLVGAYARLGLPEEVNRLIALTEDHSALNGWSVERMIDAAGGIRALIPLIEAGPEAFRESLSSMAASDAKVLEELLQEIETESVREQVETLVITADSAPLAFHSARMQGASEEEQLESVQALFDIGTEEAIYLATEGSGSVHAEVRGYTLSRIEPIYEDAMRTSMLKLYRDTDESIRVQVLRFIKRSGDRWFLREALTTAKDSYFAQRSEDEQWEMIQTLAAHGNLPAINLFFCGVATASSLWTNEHKMRVQAEAVRVLGRYHSVDGLHALKKLSRKLVGSKVLREAAKAELDRIASASSIPESEDA